MFYRNIQTFFFMFSIHFSLSTEMQQNKVVTCTKLVGYIKMGSMTRYYEVFFDAFMIYALEQHKQIYQFA